MDSCRDPVFINGTTRGYVVKIASPANTNDGTTPWLARAGGSLPFPFMPESERPGFLSIFKDLGAAGWLGVLWGTMPMVVGITLLVQLGPVSTWLQSIGHWGVFVYISIFIISSGLGLLPTYAQAVLGGWVFGVVIGLPAALVGFTGGALIGYAVARFVARNKVETVIERYPKADAIQKALVGRGFWRTLGIVTLLRIPPNSPFALTNLLLASCRVRLAPYMIAVMIGMLPRTALVIVFAAAASSQAATTGEGDIQSFIDEGPGLLVFILGLAALIISLAIITYVSNKAIKRAGLSS